MAADGGTKPPAWGFMTVHEDEQAGLIGGYLLLNSAGRPLEFHCTAPLKANRAQEILYGPTLRPYLYGEQIGQALARKSKSQPELILTDRPAALALREFVSEPVALVLGAATDEEPGGVQRRIDAAHGLAVHLRRVRFGTNELAIEERFHGDGDSLAERLAPLGAAFDLNEPFQRIRQALGEALGKTEARKA